MDVPKERYDVKGKVPDRLSGINWTVRRRLTIVLYLFQIHPMLVAEEKLIHIALLALEEAVEQAREEPVRRTLGLRLALAFLASRRECERWPFDQFWQWLAHEERKGRFAHLVGGLNGIYLQLGISPKSRAR